MQDRRRDFVQDRRGRDFVQDRRGDIVQDENGTIREGLAPRKQQTGKDQRQMLFWEAPGALGEDLPEAFGSLGRTRACPPFGPPRKKAAEWQPFLKGPPGQRKIRHFARAPSLCTLFCGAPGRPRSRQIVSPRGPKELPVKHATLSFPPKKARRGNVF